MEIWRDVAGWEGAYQVSNIGRVKRLPRVSVKESVKYTQIGRGGYYHVKFMRHKKRHAYFVHRLVAQAFLPNPENKPTVNHIDGDKLNNHLENLEWATWQENNVHAQRTGLNVVFGENNKNSKLTDEKVRHIRSCSTSSKELAKQYGVTKELINMIRRGVIWKHLMPPQSITKFKVLY